MILKVLAIYPGFNPSINEMAMAWEAFSRTNDVEFLAFAPAFDHLKNSTTSENDLCRGRFSIRWFEGGYPLLATSEILSAAVEYCPDIVIAGTIGHLNIASKIADLMRARLVLHTEYFFADRMIMQRRKYFGLKCLLPYIAQRVRTDILRRVDQVWISDPQEQPQFLKCEKKLRYLPWPHPDTEVITPLAERNFSSFIYIGSISRAKKADVLTNYFREFLNRFPEKKIVLVGPATDRAGRAALKCIRGFSGERLLYVPHVSRAEAMQMLSSAPFVFVPGDSMSWGLIGDSWRRGTPVISQTEHYGLVDGYNCMRVTSAAQFVAAVDSIEHESSFWNRLVDGGIETGIKHSPVTVAARLRDLVFSLPGCGHEEP